MWNISVKCTRQMFNYNPRREDVKIHRGDMIGVLCSINEVTYVHFGIYLGAEKGVAEFGKTYLRIVDLFEFKGDSTLVRSVFKKDQCLASEDVAKRAEDIVKNKSWGDYNLRTNNCEHFATYCKTGEAFSKQVGDTKILKQVISVKFAGRLFIKAGDSLLKSIHSSSSSSFSPGSGSSSSGSGSFSPGSGSFSPGSGSFSPGSGSFSPGSFSPGSFGKGSF